METAENDKFVYEFGKFVLDPRERTLFSNGMPLRLASKEFETLLLLVENNRKALSKDEMMTAIWQDSYVEESNLAKQISRLRKILNTDGEEFIETLPKHGYRFSTDIHRTMLDAETPVIIEKHTVKRMTVAFENETGPDFAQRSLPPERGPYITMPRIAALFAIVLIGAIAIWFLNRPTQSPAAKINTIAVLPLRPLSPGEESIAISGGLTDSLITRLGSLKHLVVRPIGSVRSFTGDEDALEIGRKLKVDAVFDGSTRESNGRLRINARLIDTATGEQIWAEKFDGDYSNVFELEDRISERVARALTGDLNSEKAERLTKSYTRDAEAFDAYLKGRYNWNKRTEQDFRKAIEYFDQAIAKDPNYALAYAGLADCYILLAVWGAESPGALLPKAKDAALKALSADGELAEAHASLAFVKWVYDWDFAGADMEFARAIELNPNYATAHHWRSYYLVSVERFDEGIAEIKRAQELEGPLSLGIMADVGEINCWAGQYDLAEQHLSDVIKLEPKFAVAHYFLGVNNLKKGRTKEAIAEFEMARDLEAGPRMLAALGNAYGVAGERQKAIQVIAELQELSKQRYVSPFSMAMVYAGLGEDDAAVDWLEKAYTERSDAMAILKVYPLLESLRSNPRFVRLQQRVGYKV